MLQRALVGSDLISEQAKAIISFLVIKFSGNFLILGVFGDSHRYLITCPVLQRPRNPLGHCSDTMVGIANKEKDSKQRHLGPREKLSSMREN